ncbi:hypothetical protein L6164_016205 [Bauhinia variegata]|uniref:Uncharacterized protein n=1 Tax=Bauhinia variegata TaxID=167791 RepID=A0ACB9NP86_BAUVA|nr:hypothetical protein L6164_016205 [Bauhinia variegata]
MSSSSRGSYRHRKADDWFPSMASLARNASRRSSPTLMSSIINLNQNRSRSCRKSTEPIHTPSSWKNTETLRTFLPLPTNPSRRSISPIMFSNSSGMLNNNTPTPPPPKKKKL